MEYILGLDPSLQKTGYGILDLNSTENEVVEKGMLKTSPLDGILVQRLMKQAAQIEEKIVKYHISFIGMEAPFFGAGSTEILFALNQFIHKVFYDHDVIVVCFPPQMLKKLVFPDISVSEVHKPHMIDKAKGVLGLHGRRLAEDVADAYWAGYYGRRFFQWFSKGMLRDEDLSEYEKQVFFGKHTFVRGVRKGVTEYTGIKFRENELFFDFKAIKRRSNKCREKQQKKDSRKIALK